MPAPATTWYDGSQFDLQLYFTDGQTRRVALYFLDYEPAARSQRIQAIDGDTGTVLATHDIASFGSGLWLTFDVTRRVTFRTINIGGVNCVCSGLFINGPTGATGGSNAAAYIGSDATTQGAWAGVYGGEGYAMPLRESLGPTVGVPGASTYQWDPAASGANVLQLARPRDSQNFYRRLRGAA